MMQLISMYLFDVMLIASCSIAFRWGGRDERTGAFIAIVAAGATAVRGPLFDMVHFAHSRYALLAIGVATLFAFDQLMVRSQKRWPIVATGFQLATVILNLTAIAEPQIAGKMILIRGKFAYPILIALVVGSLRHRWTRRPPKGVPWILPRRPGKVSLVERN